MYIAPIFCATALPCCWVTGVRPCVLRSSMQVRFDRRSDFKPQRIMGVVGQKWSTSGYHLSSTFSREFGQSMAKQTKSRSVSG